jgi:hypothetical protein
LWKGTTLERGDDTAAAIEQEMMPLISYNGGTEKDFCDTGREWDEKTGE